MYLFKVIQQVKNSGVLLKKRIRNKTTERIARVKEREHSTCGVLQRSPSKFEGNVRAYPYRYELRKGEGLEIHGRLFIERL